MFLNCSGSLIPNLLEPDNSGPDAAYGTVAHACGEMWRTKGVKPVHLIGTNVFVESGEWGHLVEIDDNMMAFVELSINWSDLLPGDHLCEQRVDYSCLTPIPNQGGTLDFAAMRYQHLTIQDEKYGKADTIYAEMNPQLMLYAFGIWLMWDWLYDFREIVIRISQPRLDHFDEWTCSVEQLLEFAEYAKERMHAAWRHDAPRTAGAKQCQYCRVQGSCAANAKMQVEMTEGIFVDESEPVDAEVMQTFKDRIEDEFNEFQLNVVNAGRLSSEHLAKLKPFRKAAERWWKAVESELNRRAAAGEDLTPYGLKPVEGRTRRRFISETRALDRLAEHGVPRSEAVKEKLCSPSQAEALLRKHGHRNKDLPELLMGLIDKPPGKATLVPVSDPRPTLVDIDALAFEDETNRETADDEEI